MRHLLIDGLNFFIRSFTANPAMDGNGDHVGGLLGFLVGLNKLVRENKPDRIFVVWDGAGGSLKRRTLFKDYKAGRSPRLNREYNLEDTHQQLESFDKQLRNLETYLSMLPVTSIRIRGAEADDVIAYLVQYVFDPDDQKVIVSSDKDLYQLIDDLTIMYVPTKKVYVNRDDFFERFGVLPENYVYVKAIVGDLSDNIKGVPRVGVKGVPKLFPFLAERECEISEVLDHAAKNSDSNAKYRSVVDNRQLVIDNVQLMQLTSPLIDPLAANAIRNKVEERPRYTPTELRMQLHRDCIQLKPLDFFKLFKEQNIRSKKV